MTIRDIVAAHGGSPSVWRKWLLRLYPDAKVGPVYSVTPAQLARVIAARAAARVGRPRLPDSVASRRMYERMYQRARRAAGKADVA